MVSTNISRFIAAPAGETETAGFDDWTLRHHRLSLSTLALCACRSAFSNATMRHSPPTAIYPTPSPIPFSNLSALSPQLKNASASRRVRGERSVRKHNSYDGLHFDLSSRPVTGPLFGMLLLLADRPVNDISHERTK